jgi:hypothetical protein
MLSHSTHNLPLNVLQMLFPCFWEDEVVVQVDDQKRVGEWTQISSIIIIMNVVGALVKRNNMTNHSKTLSLDLKVFFHASVSSIYPCS